MCHPPRDSSAQRCGRVKCSSPPRVVKAGVIKCVLVLVASSVGFLLAPSIVCSPPTITPQNPTPSESWLREGPDLVCVGFVLFCCRVFHVLMTFKEKAALKIEPKTSALYWPGASFPKGGENTPNKVEGNIIPTLNGHRHQTGTPYGGKHTSQLVHWPQHNTMHTAKRNFARGS